MNTFDQVLDKLKHFCSYRDRAHTEVKSKLYELGVWGEQADEIIAALIQENYLNEERYARSFARGKFRIKNWGRRKIVHALKFKQISPYCIKKSLEEIDEEEYIKTLTQLATDKYQSLKKNQYLVRQYKTTQYLIAKGYEPDLVREVMNGFKK